MVELKPKVCVTSICMCGGLHPHLPPHHTATPPHHHTPTTLLHHHHHAKAASGPHASRIVRKYRRSRLRRVKKQEFKKLRDMVPSLQEKHIVSKVEVIEEAIKYIDELHTALIQRFRTRGLPATLAGVDAGEIHGGNIRELVRHLLAAHNPASLPPARMENARTIPSFMYKTPRNRRI